MMPTGLGLDSRTLRSPTAPGLSSTAAPEMSLISNGLSCCMPDSPLLTE